MSPGFARHFTIRKHGGRKQVITPDGASGWVSPRADHKAQYNLGFMYEKGLGVPQDYAAAVKWYRLAANQGHATAQNNLGVMYGDGKGVPQQDYVQAYVWLTLAAAAGNKEAVGNRDIVARIMTPTQIADGQKLAREWKPKL